MGLFKQKQTDFRETGWQSLSDADLRERISPVLAYVASSLEATQGLIVSPGSTESKRFVHEVSEAIKRFAETPPPASKIDASRLAYEVSAKEFGVWQRDQVAGLQKDISDAVHSLMGTCKHSFDGRQDTIDFVHSVSNKLEIARRTEDIKILRSIIQEEATRAREVLTKHEKDHKELQNDFDDSIRALEGKLTVAQGESSRDHLTECASRGALDFYLSAICRKAQFERKLYSVAMIDLDDFKGINDLWGKQIGDRALNYFVQTLKQEFPTRAFIGRYGGDEFVVVATMAAEELEERLKRFVTKIRKSHLSLRETEEGKITISASVGLTEVSESDEPERILRRADQALYDAKRQGKGRVARMDDKAA